MRNMNPAKLAVNGMRQNDDKITLSQLTFSLAEFESQPTRRRCSLVTSQGWRVPSGTAGKVQSLPNLKDYETLGYLIHRWCVKTTHACQSKVSY